MADKTAEDFTEAQEEAAEKTAEARAEPLSLAPLTFEEAVGRLLQVKLSPEELNAGKGKRPPKGAKPR